MTLEQKVDDIFRRIQRIEQASRPKQTWVTCKWIKKLTGWSAEDMRQARQGKIIEWRLAKGAKSIEYLVESVPKEFIIQKETVTQ